MCLGADFGGGGDLLAADLNGDVSQGPWGLYQFFQGDPSRRVEVAVDGESREHHGQMGFNSISLTVEDRASLQVGFTGSSVSCLLAGLGLAGRMGVICSVGVAHGSSDLAAVLGVSFL